jgi:hypothetical protein
MNVLRLATAYERIANEYLYKWAFATDSIHQWAAGVVNVAFEREMGRPPTPAERQLVMAVGNLESSYGRGWKAGKGKGSHNWGAVQSRDGSGFSHEDSSVQGKYVTKYKSYPDDISGAADVVRLLFKSAAKQQMPDPKNKFRTLGGPIPGPSRGELITEAAKIGDTLAFSRAMWYTSYFEGFATDFTDRMKDHATGVQQRIDKIASALGESSQWSFKTNHFLPNSTEEVKQKIASWSKKAAGSGEAKPEPQFEQQAPAPAVTKDLSALESLLWF